MTFNFEEAFGDIIPNLFHTDKIDISRLQNIGTPDEPNEILVEYKDIKCNLEFVTIDNPDPSQISSRPVIKTINIHCRVHDDLKNNDKIIAYKQDADGNTIGRPYVGVVGEPSVTQSGTTAMMTIVGG